MKSVVLTRKKNHLKRITALQIIANYHLTIKMISNISLLPESNILISCMIIGENRLILQIKNT